MDALAASRAPADEIDRAFKTYMNLPELIDLRLSADGIHLSTSDLPGLLSQLCGVDLNQCFTDACQKLAELSPVEKSRLSASLALLFTSIGAFVLGRGGVLVKRSKRTAVGLPSALTQGFVQELIVESEVQFRLKGRLSQAVSFYDMRGISITAGGKLLSLNRLQMQARNGKYFIKPRFDERSIAVARGTFKQRALGTLKDWLVTVAVRAPALAWPLPLSGAQMHTNLSAAEALLALLHEPQTDIIRLCEKVAGAAVSDPLMAALLSRAKRIAKNLETIELEREAHSTFDLGGPCLKLAPFIKFLWRASADELTIENISGVEFAIPFQPPVEWQTLGIDLGRTIPKTITRISLALPDASGLRRLVADTGPGCWLSVDLCESMLPAQDADGNWVIFGAASNPISGTPQRFFIRFDKDNNLHMTAREIAQVVTQTASEGFDPNDPATWTWAAVALGGKTLLAAADSAAKEGRVSDKIKDGARKLGRIIGRLMNEI